MKLKLLFIFAALLLAANSASAQAATSPENAKVEKAVLNYIENFFENKYEEMNTSLHPRLAKRGLNPDKTMSDDFPPAKLKELMSKKKAFPVDKQGNKVTDINVFGNMANATLHTGYPNMRWVEYVHLVKEGDDWKIINVFWEYYPMKKRKKQ